MIRVPTTLPTDEFLAKMDIWLKLLGREFMKK
jgi:hypothetical protein